jgi:excisionase family DNA binding protein
MSTAPSATSLLAQEIADCLSKIGTAQKRIYTIAEASRYLGISESTLRGLVRAGDLKDVDIVRGQLRFDVRDLDRFIEERKR